MMKHVLFLAMVLFAAQLSFGQQTINAANSKVQFEISNWSINTVEGFFTGMTGSVNFNPKNLSKSSFSVCIDASTVNTDNKKRDKHLKTDDFFHVEKYPDICFESTTISKSTNGYVTTGVMTMHGKSQKVTIPFTFTNNTFIGKLKILRTDFEVGSDGGFMVGEEVSLEIICALDDAEN